MHKAARLVARALRGVANRLDPEPPYMQEALRILGWRYDGSHWCSTTTTSWNTSGASWNTNATAPYGSVEWHMGLGEDEG